MAVCPFATYQPVPSENAHSAMTPNTLIFHSVAGSAQSAVNYFSGGGTNLGSHFILFPDGHLVQQVDTSRQAWANVEANRYAISCETGNVRADGATDAGFAVDLWTDQQIATMVKLAQWCHDTHQVALRLPPSAAAGGVGYHNLFPEWSVINGGGTACPGAARVQQFRSTVLPAIVSGTSPAAAGGLTVDQTQQIIAWIAALAKQGQDQHNALVTSIQAAAYAQGQAVAQVKADLTGQLQAMGLTLPAALWRHDFGPGDAGGGALDATLKRVVVDPLARAQGLTVTP